MHKELPKRPSSRLADNMLAAAMLDQRNELEAAGLLPDQVVEVIRKGYAAGGVVGVFAEQAIASLVEENIELKARLTVAKVTVAALIAAQHREVSRIRSAWQSARRRAAILRAAYDFVESFENDEAVS